MTNADTQQLAALSLMMLGISFLVAVGVYVWYAVMFAKVLKRFGQPAWSAWVPVYNEMQLFKIGGQQPWLALLLYVPLAQIVGIVFKVFALHRISQQSWRGIGTTVLGVLLPPVWATVLAFGPSPDPEQGRMPVRSTPAGEIPPVAPTGPLAGTAPGAPAPAAAAPSTPVAAPAAPDGWFLAQQQQAGPAPIVPPAPTAAPVQPAPPVQTAPPASWAAPANAAPPAAAVPGSATVAGPAVPPPASAEPGGTGATGGAAALSSLFAPPSDAPPAPAAAPAEPARIPGRIEPLPPAPVMPPPAATPVSPAATPPAPPAAAPATPAAAPAPPAAAQPVPSPLPGLPVAPPPGLAAAAATPIAGYDPADAETIVTGDGEDDPFDRTVVVTRRPTVPWRLVLDDGTPLSLDAVVVVLGRNPREALTGEQRLVVPDPSRTLSKTHAVLRLEGEQWAITDLDSTNGVMVPDGSGVDQLIDAGVPTPVGDRFVLGTLGVRLERVDETAGGR